MNKVVKIEKILIDKDKIPKIMKIFGCGKTTVYNALASGVIVNRLRIFVPVL